MPNDVEIRMGAVEAAAAVATPSDDIGNLLVHADWIASYIKTGRLPEIESEHSVIAAGAMVAA
jgi:hypothetical protein